MNRKERRRAAALGRPVEREIITAEMGAFGSAALPYCARCGDEMDNWIETSRGRWLCHACASELRLPLPSKVRS